MNSEKKRILICGDNTSLLDHMHTWLHDDPRNYVVTRGDGLDRTLEQYRAGTFDLVIEDLPTGLEWICLLDEVGKTVLHITDHKHSTRPYLLKKDLNEQSLRAKVAELLKRKYKIVVADDHARLALAIKIRLEKEIPGCDIHIATNLEQATRLCNNIRPDLLIIDTLRTGGLALAEKAYYDLRIPTILTTTEGVETNIPRLRKVGTEFWDNLVPRVEEILAAKVNT